MNTLWEYFWPPVAAGLLSGAIAGIVGFRRSGTRIAAIALGLAVSLGLAALWHGPAGAADRLTTRVERQAREALAYYEVPQISARLHRSPLTRQLMFSGRADDFQRTELARLFSQLPGVSKATWSGSGGIPLIVEALLASVLGYLLGLLLAYLIELRRRYNAQWNW